MKKAFFVILFTALAFSKLQAQVMAAGPKWVTIKSDNLRCWECKERLESYLIKENHVNMENGMLKWVFNLLGGEIRVQYLPDRVSVDDIRLAMNNAGFDADTTKAEPTVYKKLPLACKTVAEGGGPKKNKPCHLEPM
ncbi:hypothetical protein [Parasediminibacterium sp. JCM 36343]|uniref:hypothetical protein n=1 Tax=Parasediminibacterium sp. JCM 36343 TaxID=3374279 RepID=UPI00397A473B